MGAIGKPKGIRYTFITVTACTRYSSRSISFTSFFFYLWFWFSFPTDKRIYFSDFIHLTRDRSGPEWGLNRVVFGWFVVRGFFSSSSSSYLLGRVRSLWHDTLSRLFHKTNEYFALGKIRNVDKWMNSSVFEDKFWSFFFFVYISGFGIRRPQFHGLIWNKGKKRNQKNQNTHQQNGMWMGNGWLWRDHRGQKTISFIAFLSVAIQRLYFQVDPKGNACLLWNSSTKRKSRKQNDWTMEWEMAWLEIPTVFGRVSLLFCARSRVYFLSLFSFFFISLWYFHIFLYFSQSFYFQPAFS